MKETKLIVGFRETSRMIKQDRVKSIVLAEDTDDHLRREIISLCEEYEIPIEWFNSKRKLGYSCGIERPAAVVAYLK